MKDLNFLHDTSTPYRPETNGVAERAVRRVKAGTACTLLQSGWNVDWWPEAMNCYCLLRNVTDAQKDGSTPYRKRYGQDYSGPVIPFGALLEYLPVTEQYKSRTHKYGNKMLQGILRVTTNVQEEVGAETYSTSIGRKQKKQIHRATFSLEGLLGKKSKSQNTKINSYFR